jgi:hypothetical protein
VTLNLRGIGKKFLEALFYLKFYPCDVFSLDFL